jgi:hypothetical protein
LMAMGVAVREAAIGAVGQRKCAGLGELGCWSWSRPDRFRALEPS